jgi:hypothetical protein
MSKVILVGMNMGGDEQDIFAPSSWCKWRSDSSLIVSRICATFSYLVEQDSHAETASRSTANDLSSVV